MLHTLIVVCTLFLPTVECFNSLHHSRVGYIGNAMSAMNCHLCYVPSLSTEKHYDDSFSKTIVTRRYPSSFFHFPRAE